MAMLLRLKEHWGPWLGNELVAKLLGPGLWALTIKVASAALSYVMLVAFARMMDAVNYGQFGVMLNVSIVLSTIVAVGLPTGIMRFWPGHMARGEMDLAQGFHNDAQLFLVTLGLVLLALGACASWSGWWTSSFGLELGALFVACMAVSFSFGDYYANALRAQGRVLWSMVPRDIMWRVVSPLLAALVLYFTGNLSAGKAFLSCIAVMTVVAVCQAWISRNAARHLTQNAKPRSTWANWHKPLLPLAGASIVYAMVQQLDVVIIGTFLGAEKAGAYFAAQKTASLLGLAMIAGGLIAAPLMSAAFQSGRSDELQRICKMLAAAIAVTTAVGFVVLLVIGKSLLGIFDPAYESAYPLLIVLAFGYTIDALAGPTAYLMQMTSLEGVYLRIMAIVYGFVLSLQILFVPIYGAIAAACATALGVGLWNIISIYHLRRSIGVDSSILSFFLPPRQV
jgi:O-antigen/teichoic acid export membrane protein